jgi:hypothetical protein
MSQADLTLQSMGREWAELYHRFGRAHGRRVEPPPWNNRTHDAAVADRWRELTGEFPAWYQAEEVKS